jgi:hypothetical protein
MGKGAKLFGALLLFVSVVLFLINFGIWRPALIYDLLPVWLWNPFSLLTPRIVGDIPLISGSIGWILNYVFALVYSAVMFVIGAFAFLKS